jgi:hypothetical protein
MQVLYHVDAQSDVSKDAQPSSEQSAAALRLTQLEQPNRVEYDVPGDEQKAHGHVRARQQHPKSQPTKVRGNQQELPRSSGLLQVNKSLHRREPRRQPDMVKWAECDRRVIPLAR